MLQWEVTFGVKQMYHILAQRAGPDFQTADESNVTIYSTLLTQDQPKDLVRITDYGAAEPARIM